MDTNKKTTEKKLATPILILAFLALSATFGCSKSELSTTAPPGVVKISDPHIDSMGVFADTDHGLIKIGVFGSQIGMKRYQFEGTFGWDSVKRVDAFYINIPQFVLSDENGLFWSDTQLFRSQFPYFDDQNRTALAVNIQKVPMGFSKSRFQIRAVAVLAF